MLSSSIIETVSQVLGRIQDCDRIRPPEESRLEKSKAEIEELGRLRGRPLIYPMIPSGRGSGPYVEMIDGSVKMDMICGIGVHLFGHGHPDLIMTSLKASLKATTMQGTLMPCREYADLCRRLLKHTKNVPHLGPEAQSKLEGVWLTTCGTMCNELALKIMRQKKAPAYKVIGFKNCFAGRSVAMQELTDEPKYREGQPSFDQFEHIDFYDDAKSLAENVDITKGQIDAILKKSPQQFCGLCAELVQGEGGGFRSAPREWWIEILKHARSSGLAIWFDEVQTFGRTGELFAYQRLGLGEFVDLLTLAKPLHCAAVMWTADYAPKPGLIAGTFAGGTVPLALGSKVIDLLTQGGFLGPEGQIQKMENFILKDWEARKARVGKKYGFGRINLFGGMIAFELLDGKAETIKNFLNKLFEKGVIGFSAGRQPVLLRFLPPMGVLTEGHWLTVMEVVEKTLEEFV